LNKLGNRRRTGRSLITPTLIPATKKHYCFVRGHREIILPWQQEQEKAAFLGRKREPCYPKAGSSIAL